MKNINFLSALLLAALLCSSVYGQCLPISGGTLENVETGVVGSPGTYPAGWTNGAGGFAWYCDAAGTPSSGTGPSVDHTLGTSAGKYFFTEASLGVLGATFILNAPAFDATGVVNPSVSFWYHMYGATTGTLALQQDDGLGGWTTIWSLTGQQQTGNAAAWRNAIVPVTPDGANMIIVRFHYTRGSSFTGDTAIDDITIGASSQPALYETNSPEATMTVNGVVGSPCAPTVINVPFNTGATATLFLGTNQVGGVLGGHWEIGIQPGPMIPGLPLGNGELINVDYQAPNFFWMNGGSAGADFFAMPGSQLPFSTGGSMTASFTVDTLCPMNITVQGVVVGNEAVAPLSVYLTQATQIAIASTNTRLFLGDDNFLTYTLTGPAVNFYGAAFTDIKVCSNGRVGFGAGDNDFSPSVSEAQNNIAFVGCWTDFEPNFAGCISVFEDGLGEVSVAYEGVQNWGTAEFSTFVITIKASGEIVINNMDNVAAYAANSFIGISRGNTFATDPGVVDYTLGVGVTLNGTDMIYNMVTTPGAFAAPGITSISFMPNLFTNYDWTAL